MSTHVDRIRAPIVAAILFAAVAAFGADWLRAHVTARLWHVKETSDVYALPPPAYVKRLSLGYDEAVASVLWASLLYQYGVHVGQNRRFSYSTAYLRTIFTLQPDLRAAYKFAGTFVTMQVAEPERRELEDLRDLLAEGTKQLPDDPDVWGAYATFLLFDGAQFLDPQERKAWRVEGATAAQRAVELGYFQDKLALNSAIYLQKEGYTDLAIAQLERAYAVAPNEETRERIMARLQKLQARTAIERLQRGQLDFLRRWQEQAPFLDEGVFLLTGPARDPFACTGRVGEAPECAPGWRGAQAAR